MATKLTTQQFIEKARIVHGARYNYSQIEYRGRKHSVVVICAQHGAFTQTPNDHLSGNGCNLCGRERTNLAQVARKLTKEQFIENAKAVHGTRYDYSAVLYEGAHLKIKIICAAHGPYEQSPTAHVSQGQGCPSCKFEKLRLDWLEQAAGRPATLYFVELSSRDEVFYKIGITFDSVRRRYSGEKKKGGYNVEILATHTSSNSLSVWEWEQSIMTTFEHLKYKPKNRFKGFGECFSSADEILAIFPL